jgi:uroporphyrin-III C-methyltransferase/precorrin-2 dehydrogenase/sirohydrochlorin ferrochelatase
MTRRAGSPRAADRGGFVSLVGAGPGDPALLTARAIETLVAADLVLHDGLVPAALRGSFAGPRWVSVARRVGRKTLTQAQVSARMIAAARRGLRVVRLKSGDAFVFGRGGEEARALRQAGIAFEVVPGVSTALAAPALAGIPITHRGVSAGFVVVSGHARESYEPLLGALPPTGVTVVVLMGLGERRQIARVLAAAGWRAATPAAIVTNASQPQQRVWTGTLAALGLNDGLGTRHAPGVIVIGDVVREASPPGAAVRRRKAQE